MKFEDKVYGLEEINEPILIELINSKAIQRLKDISQRGLPIRYSPQPYFSRYEHSIGVMILLRRLGADIKEQIAGLLHDVSHPTFSHLIDWVVGDPEKQEHQDNLYETILNNSDIPLILKNRGFDVLDFIDLNKYSLLERDAPCLCADRVDYCLRVIVAYGGKIISDNIRKHIKRYGGQIVFDLPSAAYNFAHEYASLQRHSWGNDEFIVRYSIFAKILKRALEIGLIKENDFFGVESNILSRIENTNDILIKENLDLLIKGFLLNYNLHNGIIVRCKFRFVNPEIIIDGSVKKLSEIDQFYSSKLELQKNLFKEIKYVDIIPK